MAPLSWRGRCSDLLYCSAALLYYVLPSVLPRTPQMGLNGVDNGQIWFTHVRVPRDAMLDRWVAGYVCVGGGARQTCVCE